jgi:hypothetical protein
MKSEKANKLLTERGYQYAPPKAYENKRRQDIITALTAKEMRLSVCTTRSSRFLPSRNGVCRLAI